MLRFPFHEFILAVLQVYNVWYSVPTQFSYLSKCTPPPTRISRIRAYPAQPPFLASPRFPQGFTPLVPFLGIFYGAIFNQAGPVDGCNRFSPSRRVYQACGG